MSDKEYDPDKINFLDDGEEEELIEGETYNVIIADDEEEVHRITKFVLEDFEYNGRTLNFLDAYSGEDTRKILSEEEDIAILFLDVVMENNQSGLEVVEYLRNDLNNNLTRIILRTGEPGEAPEEKVIRDYDINDYRLKTELTSRRLKTTMYSALRNYRDLKELEMHKAGLEKIISASSTLFNKKNLDEFLISILEELASFQSGSPGIVFLSSSDNRASGIISQKEGSVSRIIAATGKYKVFNGQPLEAVPALGHLSGFLNDEHDGKNSQVRRMDSGLIVISSAQNFTRNFIYIEGDPDSFDFELIDLFLTHFSIALDNLILSNLVLETQEEIVFALADTVESHFEETGKHVKRISRYMYNFALKLHFSKQEAEMIRLASTMHDLGKVNISDAILRKPGKLSFEEFEEIKTHPYQGYKILHGSNLPVLTQAAEMALNHHEKFDGTGYPGGKKGNSIALSGRMMTIIDVYDVVTHNRIYRQAVSHDEAVKILEEGSGSHFDPELLKVFLDNMDFILGRESSSTG